MTDNELNPEVELEMEVEAEPTVSMEMEVDMGSGGAESNAEAWAVGERHGVPVQEGDQTYHNNSKYYAQTVAQEKVHQPRCKSYRRSCHIYLGHDTG